MRPLIITGEEKISPGRSMTANCCTGFELAGTPSRWIFSCLAASFIRMTWMLPEQLQMQANLTMNRKVKICLGKQKDLRCLVTNNSNTYHMDRRGWIWTVCAHQHKQMKWLGLQLDIPKLKLLVPANNTPVQIYGSCGHLSVHISTQANLHTSGTISSVLCIQNKQHPPKWQLLQIKFVNLCRFGLL